MEKKDTIMFMQRVRSYYPEFIIDDFKISEWHNQLKDYDTNEVNARLDKHLKSETYGDYPPKLNYILMGLTKVKEKNIQKEYIVACNVCGKAVNYAGYDEHFRKCNAIEYVIREAKKHLNKDITRGRLEQLTEETFWEKYDALLEVIKSKLPGNDSKKKLIQAYFGEIDLSEEDIKEVLN